MISSNYLIVTNRKIYKNNFLREFMVIPIKQDIFDFDKYETHSLDRGYWFKPQQSLKDLVYINNECRQSFYPFYGATSVRRHTAISNQHKNNRQKRINRKRGVKERVKRSQRLDGIMAEDKKARKGGLGKNWKRAY